MLQISVEDFPDEAIVKAVQMLDRGGVVAHGTDTCYGLAADLWDKEAYMKLVAIKQMDPERPVSLICADFEMAAQYGDFSPNARKIAKKYWPGQVTLIVPKKEGAFPDYFNPGKSSVGLRVPAHKISVELIKRFGKPLTSTSANVTGENPAYSVPAIMAAFEETDEYPDVLLDCGELDSTVEPSTIIDVSGPMPIIRRKGSVKVLL